MRKHLYFYSSNLEQTKELRNDDRFEPVPKYYANEHPLTSRNEYGRIKTDQNFYHFLFGRLSQTNCPWCGALPELMKVHEHAFLKRAVYCIQCTQCGGRGPTLNVDMNVEQDENVMSHYKALMWDRYNHRRSWDEGFVNPYEENYE